MPRRATSPKLIQNLGKGQPVRNLESKAKTASQLRSGDRQGCLLLAKLVVWNELPAVGYVDHLLKREHLDLKLVGVPAHQLLRGVGAIKAAPICTIARSGVIAADYEMRAAEIAPNDGMPYGFTWPRQTHGKRKQAHDRRLLRIAPEHVFVAANPGIGIHVAGLRHSDNRMQ